MATQPIDELIISVRVAVEGVKEGLAVAKAELGKFDELRKNLQEAIRLKLDESGITAMRARLDEIARLKQELNTNIRFGVSDAAFKQLKNAIEETKFEISEMEKETARLGEADGGAGRMSKEFQSLQSQIESAKDGLAELEEEMSITVNADEAKRQLIEVSKEQANIERDIAVKMESEGINEAQAKLRQLAEAQKEAAGAAKDLERNSLIAYAAIGAAAGKAFAAVASAVKNGIAAYNETVEAQTKLSNIMGLTMGAQSAQVDEILRLTEAQESLGVVSAKVQQAGAQELSTYLSQTDSLKKLIPVMNDMIAQQHGFGAEAGQAANIATMLGKVMDGQTGALKRYGYSFSAAQEEILQTGQEAERAAVLFEVVTASIGGTNAALARTDSAKIAGLAIAAEEASAAFGEALTPSIAALSEGLSDLLGGIKAFAEEHPALVSGATASAAALTLGTAAISAYHLATIKILPAIKAFIVANTALTTSMGILGAASLAIGAIIAVFQSVKALQAEAKQKQEELNASIEQMNRLLGGEVNADNLSEYEAELARIKNETDKAYEISKEFYELLESEGVSEENQTVGELNGLINELSYSMKALGLVYDENLTVEENYMAELAKMGELQDEFTRKVQAYEKTVKLADWGDFVENVDKQTTALEGLKEMIDKVNAGNELSVSELRKLAKEYPAIAELIANNGVEYGLLKGKMEEVYDSQKRLTVQTIREEIKKTEAVVTAAQTRIGIYAAEIAVMGSIGEGADWAAISEQTAHLNELKTMLALIEEIGKDSDTSTNDKAVTAYEREIKLLEQKRALTEQTAAERLAELEAISKAVKRSADEEIDIAKRLYAARKEAADEWLAAEVAAINATKGSRDDNTDFAAIIASYQNLKDKVIEVYADYPETLKAVFAEIDAAEIDATKARADKVLAIESEALDKRIALYDKQRNLLKALNGLTMGDGSEFSYGAADEINAVKCQFDAVSAAIDEFEAKYQGDMSKLTDAEKSRYDGLIKSREAYNSEIISLSVQLLKEEQNSNKKLADEAKKNAENQLKAIETLQKEIINREKAASAERVAAIKARYDAEIALAKDAAVAEVAVYEARIAAIDELMKQESRADRDESLLDRIKRAQELLKYETSDANKYELSKEIANLQAEYDKNQRNDALNDEKAALKAEIDAIKNNGAERVKELEKARDSEISLEQEALNFYVEKLQTELDELKGVDALKLEEMQASLASMKDEYTKNQKELETIDKKAATTRRLTWNGNTNDVINDLWGRLTDFANIGSAWGDALISGMSARMGDFLHSAAVGTTNNSTNINQTMNFYAETVTPSQLSKAAERTAQDLARYT